MAIHPFRRRLQTGSLPAMLVFLTVADSGWVSAACRGSNRLAIAQPESSDFAVPAR
jgi:hypothetical protein